MWLFVSLYRAVWITWASSSSASLAPPRCHKMHCSTRQKWSKLLIAKWEVSPSWRQAVIKWKWWPLWSANERIFVSISEQKLSSSYSPEMRILTCSLSWSSWRLNTSPGCHQGEASQASKTGSVMLSYTELHSKKINNGIMATANRKNKNIY